ncbi:DUF3426 domain-containing protein [Desulfoglaeba alkanexedens ALDC]|uniref:DUF3426 domain-containing protein n=2 Tax=Desulfoglaeba alkanexedens TaxID=361111 RepID=A0A4P8L2C1_9BACT|nr:DUF3426 domain-containing protein [Desulfoglaeba alkanexedens ALDC]
MGKTMIVTCEICQTKFRLDLERIGKSRVKVRCSRCGHVFVVEKPAESGPSSTFAEAEAEAEAASASREETLARVPPIAGPRIPPPREKKSRKGLIGVLLLLAVVMIGGLYAVARMGILGGGDSESRDTTSADLEKPAVSLINDTEAFFLQNETVGQIFVVQGHVVNESPRPVSFILLEGKIYTEKEPVVTQRAYCGNVLSRQDLTRMDMTEIQNVMMNREGADLANVHVPPQGRVPFMVVFHNLPDLSLLTDYSVEVVSAQFDSGG